MGTRPAAIDVSRGRVRSPSISASGYLPDSSPPNSIKGESVTQASVSPERSKAKRCRDAEVELAEILQEGGVMHKRAMEASPRNEEGTASIKPSRPAASSRHTGQELVPQPATSHRGAESLEDQNEKTKSDILYQYFQDEIKPKEPHSVTRAVLMNLLVQTLDVNTKVLKERAKEIELQKARIQELELQNMQLQLSVEMLEKTVDRIESVVGK